MPEFVLKIQELQDGHRNFDFPIEAAWLGSALDGSGLRLPSDFAPGRFLLTAHRSGADVIVQGKLETRIVADCVRCLGDAPVPVSCDFTTHMSPLPPGVSAAVNEVAVDGDDEDFVEDEIIREHYAGDDIVLDGIVREHIILEVPMQPLCAEDCKGIEIPAHVRPPADFGKEEGVADPRFAPLRKLAEKLGKG